MLNVATAVGDETRAPPHPSPGSSPGQAPPPQAGEGTLLAKPPAGEGTALDERSRYLRQLIVRGLEGGGRGHVGSSLSLVEILRVLYDDVLRYRARAPKWAGRDRMILSKGHGCLALYAILADKGFIPLAALDTFCHRDSD